MLKQKNLLILATIATLVALAGCSQSDDNTTGTTTETLTIDGYTLPSDPGEAGKATLLGIDSNNNGVRDDVEIYIYKRFRNFENSRKDRAIAMQYAKATQIIIQEPEMAYKNKTYVVMHDVIDCKTYVFDQEGGNSWESWLKYSQNHKVYDAEFKDKIFNTRERLEAYMQYNDSLSGHVYDSRPAIKEKCETDIDALGK